MGLSELRFRQSLLRYRTYNTLKNDLQPLTIAGESFAAGTRRSSQITLARLYDYTELTMPFHVVRGKKPGPTMFVSAAVHGDEVTGTEIVKRLLRDRRLRQISGTLITIPIVNAFGYNNRSRYLPDRRDLNRSFPGSANGSLGARIAHIFLNEFVAKCDFGIDLHSGSNHRSNLPQIRAVLDDAKTEELASAFGAPVILNAKLRPGSLRASAAEFDTPVLVFEGGEGLRYDEKVIRTGLRGIIRTMVHMGMLEGKSKKTPTTTFRAKSSHWIRAPQSGGHRALKNLGARVISSARLGVISDALGENRQYVSAKADGVIIGQNLLPLVNKGDALFHVATFENLQELDDITDELDEYLDGT